MPNYRFSPDGTIESHVHIKIGPSQVAWVSASGHMTPAPAEASAASTNLALPITNLAFDDFWVTSGDAPLPRASAQAQTAVDEAIRKLGHLFFFKGLSDFPLDYASLESGFVAFRFPPLDSCIVAKRAPGSDPLPGTALELATLRPQCTTGARTRREIRQMLPSVAF